MPFEVKVPLLLVGGAALQAVLAALGVHSVISYCLGLVVGVRACKMVYEKFDKEEE